MAPLIAQLESPNSSTPKLSAFNAMVEHIREKLFPEVHVTTDSSQKKGRGD